MWIYSTKIRSKTLFIALMATLIIFTLYSKFTTGEHDLAEKQQSTQSKTVYPGSIPLWEQKLDFRQLNYNNETGNPSGCYLVPNYIHYINFGGKPLSYIHLICVLAVLKNQKPHKIFFHYDNEKTFSGKYWDVLKNLEKFQKVLVMNKVELPNEVFGQPLSDGWKQWHGSDVMRIKMLMKYGGVYLDADCYLVKSIDRYRIFEMTLNWDEGQFLGNQVLIGHKDARFLQKYLDTYKFYDKDKWYYNGGERPTVEILYKEPELIHRVKVLFGADIKFSLNIFQRQWEDWKNMYIIHLLSNHQYLFKSLNKKAVFPVEFDENNVAYYNITFREMAYDVYDIANINWPQNRFDNEATWPASVAVN